MTAVSAAPAAGASAADANLQKLYGSRWERSYAVVPEFADDLQARLLEHIQLDTEFPNPQEVRTTYVRSGSIGAKQ